jgi:MoaA/NifB/PqqE/SkfB family radical SAM enzyme
MFFHVILTTACNIQCVYCYGEALEDIDEDFSGFDVDCSLPKKIGYDIYWLGKFCERDKERAR